MKKKVTRNTTVLFALMAAAGLVQAADANWAGVYVGFDGGLGNHSNAKWRFPADGGADDMFSPQATGGTFNHAMDGKLWGIHIGENRQFGNLVVGLEGSFAATDIDGGMSSDISGSSISGSFHVQTRRQAAIKSLATLTPRVGYVFGNWMPYGKAGLALAEIDTRMHGTQTGTIDGPEGSTFAIENSASFHRGHYHLGWTAGIGVEYALPADSTGAWVFGVEYNYYQFDGRTYGGQAQPDNTWPVQYDLKPTARTLMLRASYNFGAHARVGAGDGGSSGGSWEGLYAGVDALTAIHGHSSWNFPTDAGGNGAFAPNAGGAFSNSPGGNGWGVHVGENRQFGNLVVGVEGSWTWTDLSAKSVDPFMSNPSTTARASMKSLATLTPRIGYAFGNLMPYAKLGFALAEVDATLTGDSYSFDQAHFHEGRTAGVGIEYVLPLAGQNLVVGLEYNRYEFNAKDYGGQTVPDNTWPVQFNLRPSLSAVNARLSYRF